MIVLRDRHVHGKSWSMKDKISELDADKHQCNSCQIELITVKAH